ncbi:MAG TPA: DNA-processing protein DprA [Myxococcota bacterium]
MPPPAPFDPADPADALALRPWLALQSALCFRPDLAVALLREHGDPARALRASGAPPLGEREIGESLASLRRVGAVGMPISGGAYPPRLARHPDAAPLLFVQGDPSTLAAPGIAIVGSRAATQHGLALARDFAAAFARAGLVVISGLARGIDAAAHEGALEAGGRTLAVQACGPDLVYPAAHRRLANRIAAQGARITEFPPGTPPRALHFPLRNRLISGLAEALLVIEARERSGTLVTAGHAATQGLDVFALPGPVGAAACAGSNRLLRDGAHVALEPEDVLGVLRLGGLRLAPLPGAPADAPEAPRASGLGAAILAALERAPAHRDELAQRLARAPGELALEILELELSGRIREERDGRFRVVSPRGAREL